jgi:hypothetical protein
VRSTIIALVSLFLLGNCTQFVPNQPLRRPEPTLAAEDDVNAALPDRGAMT